MTACGGSKADETPAADADTPSDSTSAASSDLVIYTGCGPEITDPILALFNEEYPDIHVEIIKAGSGELMARIKAEAGNPGGDVLIGGEPYLYEANAEVFEPYVSETDQDMIMSHPEGLWHPWSVMLTPIAVNTDRLPNEADWPQKLSDLADAKYSADKIAFCDPSKSGTGATITNNIVSPPFLGAYAWIILLGRYGAVNKIIKALTGHQPSWGFYGGNAVI